MLTFPSYVPTRLAVHLSISLISSCRGRDLCKGRLRNAPANSGSPRKSTVVVMAAAVAWTASTSMAAVAASVAAVAASVVAVAASATSAAAVSASVKAVVASVKAVAASVKAVAASVNRFHLLR